MERQVLQSVKRSQLGHDIDVTAFTPLQVALRAPHDPLHQAQAGSEAQPMHVGYRAQCPCQGIVAYIAGIELCSRDGYNENEMNGYAKKGEEDSR